MRVALLLLTTLLNSISAAPAYAVDRVVKMPESLNHAFEVLSKTTGVPDELIVEEQKRLSKMYDEMVSKRQNHRLQTGHHDQASPGVSADEILSYIDPSPVFENKMSELGERYALLKSKQAELTLAMGLAKSGVESAYRTSGHLEVFKAELLEVQQQIRNTLEEALLLPYVFEAKDSVRRVMGTSLAEFKGMGYFVGGILGIIAAGAGLEHAGIPHMTQIAMVPFSVAVVLSTLKPEWMRKYFLYNIRAREVRQDLEGQRTKFFDAFKRSATKNLEVGKDMKAADNIFGFISQNLRETAACELLLTNPEYKLRVSEWSGDENLLLEDAPESAELKRRKL